MVRPRAQRPTSPKSRADEGEPLSKKLWKFSVRTLRLVESRSSDRIVKMLIRESCVMICPSIRLVLAPVLFHCVFQRVLQPLKTCVSYPYSLTNGTTADASQVMSIFNHGLNCMNSNCFRLKTSRLAGQSVIGLSKAHYLLWYRRRWAASSFFGSRTVGSISKTSRTPKTDFSEMIFCRHNSSIIHRTPRTSIL